MIVGDEIAESYHFLRVLLECNKELARRAKFEAERKR